MSGVPVTLVDSGGLAVTAVDSGAPLMTAVDTGGLAVTLVDSGAAPFVVDNALVERLELLAATTALWEPSDRSLQWQDRAGTTTPVTADAQPLGRMKARSGGSGYDLVAPADTERPLSTSGGTFDGVDDALASSFTSGTGTTLVGFYKGTGDGFALIGAPVHDGGRYIGVPQNGSASTNLQALTTGASIFVDGIEITTTRGDLFNALCDNQPHIWEVRGAVLTDWGGFALSNYDSAIVSGVLGVVALLDEAAADINQARTLAYAFAASEIAELAL